MKLKSTQKKTTKSIKIHILPYLVGVLIVIVLILGYWQWWTYHELRVTSSLQIKMLTKIAVDNISRDVPKDAISGNLYIHEEKLTLPAQNDSFMSFKYFYQPAQKDNNDFQSTVNLSVKQNVDNAEAKLLAAASYEDAFAIIPRLQACNRGYQLTFGPNKTDGVKEVFQKKLKDGRTLYVGREEACQDINQEVLPYLKQIDSY